MALMNLHGLIDLRYPLPPMRLWAASPDFAVLVAGIIGVLLIDLDGEPVLCIPDEPVEPVRPVRARLHRARGRHAHHDGLALEGQVHRHAVLEGEVEGAVLLAEERAEGPHAEVEVEAQAAPPDAGLVEEAGVEAGAQDVGGRPHVLARIVAADL